MIFIGDDHLLCPLFWGDLTDLETPSCEESRLGIQYLRPLGHSSGRDGQLVSALHARTQWRFLAFHHIYLAESRTTTKHSFFIGDLR
jgi:hypothetical protein